MQQIDLARLDLNLLVVLEALLEERHVGRAATRLRLSQSATSHALGRLRRLFDDPLFLRQPSGVEPTPRARDLSEPLNEVLVQMRRLMSPAKPFDPSKLARAYTVATHDYAIAVLLPRLLSLFRREAPAVDLRCVGPSYEDLTTGFDRGSVDLACGAFPGFGLKRIERIPLFEDRFVGLVCAGHPALREGELELTRFTDLPHVHVSPGNGPYSLVDEALHARGLGRRIAMTVPSALSVPSIVAGSDLVGVLPARLAADMARAQGLVTFELPIRVGPVSCDLLLPRGLAGTAEFRWVASVFGRAATEASG